MACRVAKKKRKRGSFADRVPSRWVVMRSEGQESKKKNSENDGGAERHVAAEDWIAAGNCD